MTNLTLNARVRDLRLQRISRFLRYIDANALENQIAYQYWRLLDADEIYAPCNSDGLYLGTLYEFKRDRQLIETGAVKELAQACYYLKGIAEQGLDLPRRVAICDPNEAIVVTVADLEHAVDTIRGVRIDWSKPPSSPDTTLCGYLTNIPRNTFDMSDSLQIETFLDTVCGTEFATDPELRRKVLQYASSLEARMPRGWANHARRAGVTEHELETYIRRMERSGSIKVKTTTSNLPQYSDKELVTFRVS